MPHPVIHFEIGCRDSAVTQEFYAKLFDWRIEQAGPAALVSTGCEEGIGGHITALGHEPHNYVTVYIQVEDVAAHLERVEQMGGKTVIPPTDVPGMGQFAWFSDPDGNVIGLWKPFAAS